MADMMDAAEVWNQSYQLLLDQPLELTLREMACLSDIHATNIFGTMIVLTVSSESTRTVVEKKLHKALTSIFSQVTGQPMTYVVQIDPHILEQNEATPASPAAHTSPVTKPVTPSAAPERTAPVHHEQVSQHSSVPTPVADESPVLLLCSQILYRAL
ncbi:MAG: hypothetical protein E7F65_01485 [Alloscardovia omnicolens]|nr:hypothetical protein [Alloscardovia omnicolens]